MADTIDLHPHGTVAGVPDDSEARDAALDTFLGLVANSDHIGKVGEWVKASPVRRDLFDDMVVGRIRWPRSLGRPSSRNLFGGFVIRAYRWIVINEPRRDGTGTIIAHSEQWYPSVAEIVVIDGVAELDHYSVRYRYRASRHLMNKLVVQFSDVPWRPSIRTVNPQELYMSSHGFTFKIDGMAAFPDITISDRPFYQPKP